MNSEAVGFAGAKAEEYKDSGAEPAGSLQIILANGEKHKMKVVKSTSVLSIYQHVMFLSGDSGPFDLLGGFPPKPLSNPQATCGELGLIGSSIRQKV